MTMRTLNDLIEVGEYGRKSVEVIAEHLLGLDEFSGASEIAQSVFDGGHPGRLLLPDEMPNEVFQLVVGWLLGTRVIEGDD
jgi:hypothetical protein